MPIMQAEETRRVTQPAAGGKAQPIQQGKGEVHLHIMDCNKQCAHLSQEIETHS